MCTSTRSMKASERRDIRKLKQHIESCPSIAPDSFVSRIVLHRLDQKLEQHGYGVNKMSKKNAKKTRTAKEKRKRTGLDSFLTSLRIFFFDLPLTLLFLSIVTTHLMHAYYTNYISPMIDAANWADNDRLLSEFTYYERPCDVNDISAQGIEDVTLDENVHGVDDAVENFMVHGMSMFPNILDEKVSHDLRTYIMRRNHELTDDEIIPLDTPAGRHSFGIGKFLMLVLFLPSVFYHFCSFSFC